MNHFEREFEKLFESIAPAYKMKYYKIPDFIPVGYNMIIAHKRFADGVLVTVNGNYIIEFKYQYGKLKPHQEKAEKGINVINKSYFVVRKKVLKKGLVYLVEQEKQRVFTTDNMEDLFRFFWQPDEITSQQIMIDQLIPKKPKLKLRKVCY